MSQAPANPFDIARFEDRIETLIGEYQRLLADYRALQSACETQRQHSRVARERLHGVIERIRALETQADSA